MLFWGVCVCVGGREFPNHKVRACFYSSHSLSKCRVKTCISCFLPIKSNLHQVAWRPHFHSHLLIYSPIVVKQEIVKWQVIEGGWSFPDTELYLTLTSSAQPCGLPRHCIPPATCPLGEWASKRSAWTPACLCTSASPGTGIAAPSDIHLGAGESGSSQGSEKKTSIIYFIEFQWAGSTYLVFSSKQGNIKGEASL